MRTVVVQSDDMRRSKGPEGNVRVVACSGNSTVVAGMIMYDMGRWGTMRSDMLGFVSGLRLGPEGF